MANEVRDTLRDILRRAREIPNRFGLRPYSAAIIKGAWSGTVTGSGTETVTTVPITENLGAPSKTRWLNSEECALGNLPKGTIEVGPITPQDALMQYLAAAQAAVAIGQTVHLQVTGPDIGTVKFEIVDIGADRGLHWTVRGKPVGA